MGAERGWAGGGDVSPLTRWSEEALAEAGASSCPELIQVEEPVHARGSACWVAEWAGLGKSLPGTGILLPACAGLWGVHATCLCPVGVGCLDLLHQSCLLEGQGFL